MVVAPAATCWPPSHRLHGAPRLRRARCVDIVAPRVVGALGAPSSDSRRELDTVRRGERTARQAGEVKVRRASAGQTPRTCRPRRADRPPRARSDPDVFDERAEGTPAFEARRARGRHFAGGSAGRRASDQAADARGPRSAGLSAVVAECDLRRRRGSTARLATIVEERSGRRGRRAERGAAAAGVACMRWRRAAGPARVSGAAVAPRDGGSIPEAARWRAELGAGARDARGRERHGVCERRRAERSAGAAIEHLRHESGGGAARVARAALWPRGGGGDSRRGGGGDGRRRRARRAAEKIRRARGTWTAARERTSARARLRRRRGCGGGGAAAARGAACGLEAAPPQAAKASLLAAKVASLMRPAVQAAAKPAYAAGVRRAALRERPRLLDRRPLDQLECCARRGPRSRGASAASREVLHVHRREHVGDRRASLGRGAVESAQRRRASSPAGADPCRYTRRTAS